MMTRTISCPEPGELWRDDRLELFLDIETYSETDLPTTGLYPYVEDPAFEVLLIAYAFGCDSRVRILDLKAQGAADPAEVAGLMDAIKSADILHIAHNNAFERTALGRHVGAYLPPEDWSDTMILAAYNGLPMSLEAAGEALGIAQQKLAVGKSLINYFCKPCKPTIANGGRTRNLPEHAPDKWETFKAYCIRDVEAMIQIYRRLQHTPITALERLVWCLDARINERGVRVDQELARAAIDLDDRHRAAAEAELRAITGLDNPNSVAQLKQWLAAHGLQTNSLDKAVVTDLLTKTGSITVRRALELRQLLGKTSTKKYEAMTAAACADSRVRGLTQYYGAARTGRWAGRLVQLQNLPQNHLADLGEVRELVRAGDLDTLALCYDSVPDTLSQLIRTAFVPERGNTFLVADYAAIEARVIAYLAGEKWRMEVFAKGGDIYCSSASQMFKVPVVKHGVNGHLRQKGKIAELA